MTMFSLAAVAFVCLTVIAVVTLWLQAKPRADRFQEMERVLTTLETRCKVLEGKAAQHDGHSYAPLPIVAELREELSKRHHMIDQDLREAALNADKAVRAVEVLNAEWTRRFEAVDRLSQTVGTLTTRGMRA